MSKSKNKKNYEPMKKVSDNNNAPEKASEAGLEIIDLDEEINSDSSLSESESSEINKDDMQEENSEEKYSESEKQERDIRRESSENKASENEELSPAPVQNSEPAKKKSASENPEIQAARKKRKKKLYAAAAVLLCAALIGGGVGFYYLRSKNTQKVETSERKSFNFGSDLNVITASGTTSIGMVVDTFELKLSDSTLSVEEVYLKNRDVVEKGAPILKVNTEEAELIKTKLRQNAEAAKYAYELNEIQARLDTIDAQKEYDKSIAMQKYAQLEYDNTVATAQNEIDDLEKQIKEQQELVDEYQAAVNDPSYYSKKYKVQAITDQLEEDFTLLMEMYGDERNGIQNKVNSGTSGMTGSTSGGFSGGGDFSGGGMPSGGMPSGGSGGSGSGGSSGDSGSGNTGGSTDTGSDTPSTTSLEDFDGVDFDPDATLTSWISNAVNKIKEAGHSVVSFGSIEVLAATTSGSIPSGASSGSMPGGTSGSMPSVSSTGSMPSGSTSGSSSGTSSSSGSSSSSISLTDSIVGDYDSSTTTTTSSSSGSSSGTVSASTIKSDPIYAAYQMLKAEVEEEESELETAKKNASRDQNKAEALLRSSENKLDSLNIQLKKANADLITQTEAARETLNTTNAEAAAAKETYETSMRSIENSRSTLRDTMETAQEDYDDFVEQLGDGYLYTKNAGTIMIISVSEGDSLKAGSMIAAYTDSETISVTAAVDQKYIASLTIGEKALVVFEEEGSFNGSITSIDPVTQSTSRTSVTYSVEVTLEGDVSSLSSNKSATVYFGEDIYKIGKQMQRGSEDGSASPGWEEIPEGMSGERPEGMPELPEGMTGEKPEGMPELPEGMTAPGGFPNGAPDGAVSGAPDGAASGAPDGAANGAPAEAEGGKE